MEGSKGNNFDFTINSDDSRMIDIYINWESIKLKLDDIYLNKDISNFNKIFIHHVNVLDKAIKYTLIS